MTVGQPQRSLSLGDVPQLRDTGYGVPKSEVPRMRIDAVDLVRGIVMVIMLLDHTRDFIHVDALRYDATDLTRTTVALFFTRWITHFCAPAFVFLAGTAAYLQGVRGKSRQTLSAFLVKRGLWLMLLEVTFVRLSMLWNADPKFLGFLQVIFAIGLGMVVLGGLVRFFSWKPIGVFGVAIVALHNALDGIRVPPWFPPAPAPPLSQQMWVFLHQQGLLAPFGFPGPVAIVLYPVLAWIGVICAGYAFGRVYEWDSQRRRAFLLRLGLGLTALFIALRATNLYGDSAHWSVQKSAAFTALSFLNTTKYPPSLLFLLMTLGPAIAVLGWLDGKRLARAGDYFVTFGRVPLFFYVLQWNYAHIAGVTLALANRNSTRFYFSAPLDWGSSGFHGFALWVVYAVWLVGVLLLYPLCKWFAGVKARRRDWWLSYL